MLQRRAFLNVSTAAVVAILGVLSSMGATAQTFDEAMRRQLNNDCAIMGGADPDLYGPDLFAICSQAFGSPTGTASSGGGGASSQTAAVSVENRRKTQLTREPKAELSENLGFFVTGNGESLQKDSTPFADGFDSTVVSASVGLDYRISSNWLFGVAALYRTNNGDFDAGGDFDTTSVGGTLYTSIVPIEEMFIDLSVSYASKSFEVNRRAQFTEFDAGTGRNTFNGIVSSDTDGTEASAQLQLGYDFAVGRLTVGPRLGANWSTTEIDSYAESGGGPGTQMVNFVRGAAGLALVYEEQEVDSLQGSVGAQGSISNTVGFGVLVSQMNVDYVREFEDDQRTVGVRFVQDIRPQPVRFQFQTEQPVEDFFRVGVSFVAVLKNGVQPFINLQGMVGNDNFDSYAATLGVRFEL